MKCAIISNKRAVVVPFLPQLCGRLVGGTVVVSTVNLDWAEKGSLPH